MVKLGEVEQVLLDLENACDKVSALSCDAVHYYASGIYGWSVSETRKGAIEAIAKMDESTIKKMITHKHEAGGIGFYVWSCKVLASIDTPYGIDCYMPTGVETVEPETHYITCIKKGLIAYYTEPKK